MSVSVKDWVQRYIDLGFSPLPILPRSKAPKDEAWQKLTYGPGDFDPDSNVGIHLGLGVVDVDLDSAEARALAPMFLPPTIVFGRAGSPSAHWVYLVKGKFGLLRWNGIGGNDDCILELRGINEGTGAPAQTVFPPSLHKDTGELIMWVDTDDPVQLPAPFEVEAGYLCDRGKLLALASMLARHSAGPGKRHDFRMAMAGFLFKCGLPDKDIMLVGRAVTKYTGGEMADWETTGRGTIAKLKADPHAKITGAGALKEAMVDGDKALRVLNKYLGRMEQAAKDEVIDELNARYAALTLGSTVCVLDDSRPDGFNFYTFENFRRKLIHRTLPAFQQKNGKWKSGEPIADFWLKHPDARRFDQMVYCPPPLVAGPKDYNGWKGFAVQPREGDWSLIYRHISECLCSHEEEPFAALLNWTAALCQFPARVPKSALVLMGPQGIGKGFFAEDLLGRLFDAHHFIKIDSGEQFYGRFHGELLSGRCLVFLDEATWGGDKRDAGALKSRVTSETMVVERKGIAKVTEVSMIHLIIASNEDWPIGLDKDDRRFIALKASGLHSNNAEYFNPLYAQLNSGGREAFLHAMLQWEIDWDLLRKPPRTKAKDELKQRSLPPLMEWLFDRLYTGSFGQMGWPNEIAIASLYQNYCDWANSRKVRITSLVDFGRKLSWLFDGKTYMKRSGKESHRTGKLWPLPKAREVWDTIMKSETEWDEPDEKSLQF